MKVLWVGDAPTVSTGFARCTRAVCAELHRAGHEVSVLGINHHGDPHEYPYDIYVTHPRGRGDAFGAVRLPQLVERLHPDVVVLLQDPWNVDEYFTSMEEADVKAPPVVAWLAVDAKNHPASSELNKLSHVITWTQFAIDELRKGGYTGTSSIVPLGVDTKLFKPGDRVAARAAMMPTIIGPKEFVVGVVGRNQPRKRIDLAIAYFAEFVERYGVQDACLFLHVAPTGERACDIRAVAAHYGEAVRGRIFVGAPSIGYGLEEGPMVRVYQAFDVLLTTTQGEGWGLPVHEAMACGIPCIVPDWSALGEWTENAAWKVPCTGTALSAPINMYPYTIGGIADRDATVKALWQMYSHRAVREEYGARGLALTARPELQWAAIGAAFRRELEAVVASAADAAVQAALGAPAPPAGTNPRPETGAAVLGAVEARQSDVLGPHPEGGAAAGAQKAGRRPFSVCVTVLNRYDLLRKLLLSLEKSTVAPDAVLIIDNGDCASKVGESTTGISLPITVSQHAPTGLAESWNYFLHWTRGNDRIIANDDIEFAPESIAKMLSTPGDLVFPVGIGFSCFLIRDSCKNKIGLFDESLSPGFAYFEDCDYMFRAAEHAKVNGNSGVVMADVSGTGIFHLKNGTQKIKRSETEVAEFRYKYWVAQENFIAKWGRLPDGLRRVVEPPPAERAIVGELT